MSTDEAVIVGQEVARRDDVARSAQDELDLPGLSGDLANPNLVLFVRCVGVAEDRSAPIRRALYEFLITDGWAAPRHSTSQVYYRNVGDSADIEAAAEGANARLRAVIERFRSRPDLSLIGDWSVSFVFMKPILVGQHSPNLLLTDFSFHPGPLQTTTAAGGAMPAAPIEDTTAMTTKVEAGAGSAEAGDGAVAAADSGGGATGTE